MLRSALLIAATVAVSSAVDYTYPKVCESARLQKCIHDIFGSDGEFSLGVTSDQNVLNNIMKDYTILNNFFLSQWARDDGIDTIVKNCNGLSNFYHCLGGPACFGMQSLLENQGISKEDAYAVNGIFAEYNFNCGAGLGTMLSANIKCIQNAIAASGDYLKGCTSNYLTNVKHDEPGACNHAAELASCYKTPFHLAECREQVATDTWWACASQREFVTPQFGECFGQMGCTDQIDSAFMAAHHTKNVDGSHTLTLPDRIEENGEKVKGQAFTIRF